MIVGRHYVTGEIISISVEQGLLHVKPGGIAQEETYIFPGLVDLQVNGYAGVDVNQEVLTEQQLAKLVQSLLREGVTSFFPTLITNDPAFIEQRLRFLATFQRQHSLGSIISG